MYSNHSALKLIQIQSEVLFLYTSKGKILRINETAPQKSAPRFFLSRSQEGNIWRLRYDLPYQLAVELEQLAAAEPLVQDLRKYPVNMQAYKSLLEQDKLVHRVGGGPSYYLPQAESSLQTAVITPSNQELLEAHFTWGILELDDCSPFVVIVDNGAAVAACFTARNSSVAAEAGVFTVEAYRGRGFAAQVVTTWAAAVRSSGKIPLYSTSWENTASQSVAQKLGAVQYGVTFDLS